MADDNRNSTTDAQEHDANVVYVWKIPVDRKFVKSIPSILKIVIAILSFIAFICVASGRSDNCDDEYSSTYNFFEFVTMSCFLTMLVNWIFHALTIVTMKLCKVVPWLFVDLIILGIFILFYFIGSICIAAQDCGKDNNKAAAAFGFFALFGLIGHAVLSGREWYALRQEASAARSPSQDYNPDRNMEQY